MLAGGNTTEAFCLFARGKRENLLTGIQRLFTFTEEVWLFPSELKVTPNMNVVAHFDVRK